MRYGKDFFDRGMERHNTDCVKWDAKEICPDGAVPLWVADMDFPCAEPIVQALEERAAHPCYGYTRVTEKDTGYLCDFLWRRHALRVEAQQTAMLPCVITGLRTAVRTFTNPGEDVLLLTPVYGPFYASVKENERRVLECPLTKDESGRYSIDFAKMESLLQKGVKLLMLCNPHNPVSRAWSREELQQVLDLTRKYHTVLAVDEIHAEFVYKPAEFVSILHLACGEDRVVSFMSASKTFNIAGLQQAVMISKNQQMLGEMQRILNAAGGTCGNIFALAANQAAFSACDDWLDGLMDYLDGNRKLLAEIVQKDFPDAVLTPIEATYLGWLDLSAYGMTVEKLTEICKKQGVAFTGGTVFGEAGEYHLRVNFGCPSSQLVEGMKRLKQAIEEEKSNVR